MELQVGVKVVLRNEEGKILLLRRAEKYGGIVGTWDIVGGRIDPGTPLIENLEREVREETELTITSAPRLIAAQDIIIEDKDRHVVRLTYTAHTEGEPILDMTESSEYRWCTFEDLNGMQDLDRFVRVLIEDGLLTTDSWS